LKFGSGKQQLWQLSTSYLPDKHMMMKVSAKIGQTWNSI
jgi:hypothetical protein